ncbi:hypothetical protein BaRGS_00014238 [Batillaria attramentaria]|uniref:Apple domain-containing protein n=1 Tax=Batillaria attramentaria TaxID=370345 RepID=A0ABD0L5A3_9CAEN
MKLRTALLFVGWVVLVVRPSRAVIREDLGVRKSDVADLIFTQELLWSTTVPSLIACAADCMTDDSCVCFTLSAKSGSGPRHCRGHSAEQHMNSTGGVAEPGSKLYHLKARLEEAASAQTTTLASEVSTSTEEVSTEVADTTLVETTTACPEAELQEDFVQYPWHYIYYNNLYFRDATFDDCKTECLNTPNCRVMEFWYDVEYCAGADVTPLQLPSDWRSSEGSSRIDYFQRMCA